jgi:hypothetical protein
MYWDDFTNFCNIDLQALLAEQTNSEAFINVARSYEGMQYIKKEVSRVGSKPGSSQLHLFSHFHHFTAEPQRLPR